MTQKEYDEIFWESADGKFIGCGSDFVDDNDSTNCGDFQANVDERKQALNNLPVELLRQARFFRVGRMVEGKWNQKAPVDKWNNPDNQKKFDELQYTDERQMAGFDIVGHGKGADYLVADFDHVLNSDGTFKNSNVGDWLSALCTSTYWEKSFSGDGFHVLFKPADDEFPTLASGKSACLEFGDGGKIELF